MLNRLGKIALSEVLATQLDLKIKVIRLDGGGMLERGDGAIVNIGDREIRLAQVVIKIVAGGVERDRFFQGHFGAGQTETEITLKPGTHTLQLLMGDKDHIPHTPPVMSPLTRVRVVDPSVRKPAPADARVYFVGLEDGSMIPQKSTIRFGLVNMGVAPAGIDKPNTGHHHLLIDTKIPPLDEPIPNDFNHLHFGAGQTEAHIDLAPGNHTLQLVLGDAKHYPFNPPVVSKKITITVK